MLSEPELQAVAYKMRDFANQEGFEGGAIGVGQCDGTYWAANPRVSITKISRPSDVAGRGEMDRGSNYVAVLQGKYWRRVREIFESKDLPVAFFDDYTGGAEKLASVAEMLRPANSYEVRLGEPPVRGDAAVNNGGVWCVAACSGFSSQGQDDVVARFGAALCVLKEIEKSQRPS